MKHGYHIMAKIAPKPYANYRGTAKSISEEIPAFVDEIWIGKNRHLKKMRKITTFRDKDGRIIERSFDYSDGKLRNRLYSRRTLIFNKESVESTTIRDYFVKKRVLPFYDALLEDYKDSCPAKDMLWNLTDVITNHVSTNIDTGDKILSQVKISDIQKPTKQRHTFTEYSPIKKGRKQKKFLTFLVNGLTNKIVAGSEEYNGIRFPKNDTWLPFRALTIKDSKGPFAHKFIRDKKIQGAMIEVNTEYLPQNEDEKLYAADFDPVKGAINFNKLFKPYSKTVAIGIAKHEAEHGWQYFLCSRFAEATTEWEKFVGQAFGKIKSKKLSKEAKNYTRSIRNYVPLTKELEESGNIQDYRENYIERMAKRAAVKIRKEYDKQGKVIRNNFPHIPKEYL